MKLNEKHMIRKIFVIDMSRPKPRGDKLNFRGHSVATMAALADAQCACTACTKIRVTIDHILCVLDVYGWLLDSYVVVRNIR